VKRPCDFPKAAGADRDVSRSQRCHCEPAGFVDSLFMRGRSPAVTEPPYSPDLNPIEMLFAKLKTLLRKAERRNRDALWKTVGDLLNAFTPDECDNCIRHAGYAS
jgi:transposase